MRGRRHLECLLLTARLDPLGVASDIRLAQDAVRHEAVQKTTELTPLIALVRRLRPRRVVEIGTERGGTLSAWARLAAPDALLVSVDWPEVAVQRLPSDEKLRSYAQPGQRLELIREDSHADATRAAVAEVLDDAVDFLFIDGDHSYEGARQDFELYAPFMRDRGLVAFHDIAPHRPETGCEVERLWSELRPRFRHWEFVDPAAPELGFGPWGGIGVIEYRLGA